MAFADAISLGVKRLARERVALWALTIGLSVVFGYAIVDMPRVALGIIAVLIAALALIRPLLGYVGLILGAFSLQWLVGLGLLPSASHLVLDAIAIALLAGIAFSVLGSKSTRALPKGARWLVLFVLVAALSAIVNQQAPLAAVLGVRYYIRYAPLFLAPAVFGWGEQRMRGIVFLIVGLMVVQAPVAVWQFAVNTTRSGDSVGGTIGNSSSGALTVLAIATTILVAGLLINEVISPPVGAVIVLGLCIPPALNETKVFFVAAPLLWSAMLLPRFRRNRRVVALVSIVLCLGVFGALRSYTATYGDYLARKGGAQLALAFELSDKPVEGGVLNRLPQVAFAGRAVAQHPGTLALGYGAGSLVRSDEADLEGSLIVEYGRLLRNTVFAARVLLETGVLGMLCFAGLIIVVYVAAWRLEREADDPFARAVGMGTQGSVVTLSVLSIYTGTFASDATACVLWTLAGIAIVLVAPARDGSARVVGITYNEKGLQA